MRALFIQHDHVSPPGPIAERFADRGFDIVCHEQVSEASFQAPNVPYTAPEMTDFDVVIPMGAPWSAYDDATIGAWVRPEEEALRQADAAGVPVLGICFGGQLLALAHGGSVAAAPSPEIGWVDIATDDPGLVPAGPWFQWHYDRWLLPPGATELARNPAASQAFVLRRNLAVQFHPELTVDMLTGWIDNGGHQALHRFGLDADAMVAQTRAAQDDSRRRAHLLVDGFLDRVAAS